LVVVALRGDQVDPPVVALTLIVVTLVAVPCSAISAIRFMRGDSLSEVCDGGHAERR